MQSSVDFVAALTSEPPLDFVAALSAEQGCDVCHELHAAVDELRCHECEAAICPDCARLRPDAQWACLLCDENHPMRVYESRGGRRGPRSGLRSQLRVGALAAHEALRSALLQASPRVRAALASATPLARKRLGRAQWKAHAALARARARWAAFLLLLASLASAARRRGTAAFYASSTRGSQLTRPGLAGLGRGGLTLWSWSQRSGSAAATRAQASSLQLRQHGVVLRERTAQGSLAVRRFTVSASQRVLAGLTLSWVTLRNLPVRHHATALLVASVILFAVARADSRDG
jgi:hypothetical protein